MRNDAKIRFSLLAVFMGLFILTGYASGGKSLELGLSFLEFRQGEVPDGWTLRKRPFLTTGKAQWVEKDGIKAVELSSNAALTFLEKTVSIDLKEYPWVSWQWRVDNILPGIDERTKQGDDHPIRIFFVFEPDPSKQSFWFRMKRILYLDLYHGHPMGGRFTEYLWSSHLEEGTIMADPGKPKQKLIVVEGGDQNIGKWLFYERNLYKDFVDLYGEEPRKLIFIGILNDMDQTGGKAVSYIVDLCFSKTGKH